ncbi:hypothetical protein SSX86_033038 [Deinandra increscens subsp. villosa]|uniref:Uncharacterized protein n=1 Tax=Deinandra increscens subsp. villosa TaxID=3103831 RepID=A0AAP0GH54_9ASTR
MEEVEVETCSKNGSIKPLTFSGDIDHLVSTPYVSAPSSPGEGPPHAYAGGFFYSAPTSPMHRSASSAPLEDAGGSFEFELSGEPAPIESMTSADELFFNGQIRPMKLSSHLQRPQDLAPFVDPDDLVQNDDGYEHEDRKLGRGRALQFQSRDRRRKARSMSPLRSDAAFQWLEEFKDGRESTEINEIKEKLEAEDKQIADEEIETENETETPSSGATSRSSSVGRSSKRWVFLKELLYRSKSEGRNSPNRNRNHKFWSNLSFSPSSSKKPLDLSATSAADESGTAAAAADGGGGKTTAKKAVKSLDPSVTSAADEGGAAAAADGGGGGKTSSKKAVNGVGMNRKRRGGGGRSLASAHEVHYNRNRLQAEEMRKKTFLPYREGLLGCLGFSSKGYGAMNGFARALNPVSSR